MTHMNRHSWPPVFVGKQCSREDFSNPRGDRGGERNKNVKAFSLSEQGPCQGSAHRFQRQADGKKPGHLSGRLRDMKERTEEDGVRSEESAKGGRGGLLVGGGN